MKQYLFAITTMLSMHAYAQDLSMDTSVFVLPNNYNAFVKNSNISYAGVYIPFYNEYYDEYLFAHKKPNDAFRKIYDHLTNAIESGTVKSYLTSYYTTGYYIDNKKLFIEVNKNYADSMWKITLRRDSSKKMGTVDIFYIKNHRLKCYVMAVTPVYYCDSFSHSDYTDPYSMEERNIPAIKSYCSLNTNPDFVPAKKDKTIFLDSTTFFPSIDNILYTRIKSTYAMDFPTTLWYDLSQGYNKVIDLDSNKLIPANRVWNYSIPDSISVPIVDSTGAVIASKNVVMNPSPAISLFLYTGIHEDWYYDLTQNIFYCKIRSVDIYIGKDPRLNKDIQDIKKRFKVIFN